ncbi:MAG: FAD-dependent oxidoreductase [Candidatus Dojkabacteria bacterium]|nr:FAD-dependent oxidoreductase [Candidatus Dojkabacteria bacterium]MDQ7021482.1 FAD-dependent oxidoreductase [Candidatus Dojkabacteria bacterium]
MNDIILNMLKGESELLSKRNITENVLELTYSVPNDLTFIPGQFMNISVTAPYRRPYSILDMKDGEVSFMIGVGEPGKGSDYFKEVEIGSKTTLMGPLGRFKLNDSSNKKIFIATGVGIVPFIPMIKELLNPADGVKIETELFFGARFLNDTKVVTDYLGDLITTDNNLIVMNAITKPEHDELDFFHGRVNVLIDSRKDNIDFRNTDFYVCGSNEMIKGVRTQLKELGADQIFMENYG